MDKFILGNWKMHGTRESARALAASLASLTMPKGVQAAIFPPFSHLAEAAAALKPPLALGAQDCSEHGKDGAYTGEVSASMLKDMSCAYVILGHSERRAYHQEADETVKRKAEAALAAGLIPVICVGESEAERQSGQHLARVSAQIKGSIPSLAEGNRIIVAYEPVWAIGSGAVPSCAQILEMHKTIASELTYATPGARTAILYGGSVKAANAAEILSTDGVDGVLVGGASLKTDEFGAIIAAAGQR